jgi:hypothetical protein
VAGEREMLQDHLDFHRTTSLTTHAGLADATAAGGSTG